MKATIKKLGGLILPIGFWALLAGFQIRAAIAPLNFVPALLALESALVAYMLLTRRAEKRTAPDWQKWLAWVSMGLPLTLQTGAGSLGSQTMALTGLGITLWGLSTLGKSFGIAPADRGLVAIGPYQFIRHPMYAGALLMAGSALVQQMTLWNLSVFGLLVFSAIARILWEEHILRDYALYAHLVRWRLIPGVW